MKITLLTTRRFHSTALWLLDRFRAGGLQLTPSRGLERDSDLVVQWGYDRAAARRQIRRFCEARGIPMLNRRVLSLPVIHRELRQAGIPVVPSYEVSDRREAHEALSALRCPAELTTAFGGRARTVDDARDLEVHWARRHAFLHAIGVDPVRLAVVGSHVFGRADPEWLEVARGACERLELDFAVVRLCTIEGRPSVVSIGHRRPDLRPFPGADAALIRLVESGLARGTSLWAGRGRPRPRVSIVTGIPDHGTVQAIHTACVRHGLDPEISPTIEPGSDVALLWGLHWRHQRNAWRHATAVGIPVVGGPWRTLSEQLGVLRQARVLVPAFRPVRGADEAARRGRTMSYPVLVGNNGDPDLHASRLVFNDKEMRAACESIDGRILVQALRWASSRILRVWVAGDSVLAVRSRLLGDLLGGYGGVGPWRPEQASGAVEAAAVGAGRALGLTTCLVEALPEPDGVTVLRVLHRRMALDGLPREAAEAIPGALASELRVLLNGTPPSDARPSLKVVMARPYDRRNSLRIWGISAAYHELARRGHEIVHLYGQFDEQTIQRADLVLQDPLATMGWRRRPNALNRRLVNEATVPCHLLRRPSGRRRGKLGSMSLARRLELPHPRVFRLRSVREDHLPVIVKPVHGSLGRGIFRVDDLDQLRRINPKGRVAQEYIDSGTGYSVSARVVTVRDRVVAAGVFYRRGAVTSNLSRGGRAIALTGPGASARVSTAASLLLRRIGIDPRARRVPPEVESMACRVGSYLSGRGVQMVGQDFVIGANGEWYFLEANRSFGIALFNVTDGDGYPSTRRGYRHAGVVLADGFETTVGPGAPSDRLPTIDMDGP